LESLLGKYAGDPHATTLTTTAELADCFRTKKEGVEHIISVISRIEPYIGVFLNDGRIVDRSAGLKEPSKIAAANWVAPSLLIGQMIQDALFIDAGSTTTDVIPISGSSPIIGDPSDMGRLENHQLIYSGALRTNVATIADHVIIDGRKIGTASEYFSTTGDVNLVLGLLNQADYTVPTSDGGPASIQGALCRLSRVVCSDLDHLSTDQIEEMAKYIHDLQVAKVAGHIAELIELEEINPKFLCVVAGIGMKCLAEPAARAAGVDKIIPFHELLTSIGINCSGMGFRISSMAPAISLSILKALGTVSCG
jgi:probable H4MPT-linked C1 transfer pathway protein